MTLHAFSFATLIAFAAIFFSAPILTFRDDGSRADVIVVPGGDGVPRAEKAARLWKEGRAPVLLVTGDGDCLFNKRIMIDEGVAPSAIFAECQSGSTWQNAIYSAPLLRRLNAKSALVVTNWYHSRRAVASFRAACPQMHFVSAPVGGAHRRAGFLRSRSDIENVAREYAKIGWYLVSGRILPRDLIGDGPDTSLAAVCHAEAKP